MVNEHITYFTTHLSSKYGLVSNARLAVRLELIIKAMIKDKIIRSIDELVEVVRLEKGSAYQYFVNKVTVQESYFFRDKSLFFFLNDQLIPSLIKQRRASKDYSINIWSAGCSAGQELYSMAMLLRDHIKEDDFSKWNINLYGTDINEDALLQARQGLYSDLSMRSIDENTASKYFERAENHHQLNENIRTMTAFEYHNLSSGTYPEEKFDIILCRNVFIYFSSNTTAKILCQFFDCIHDEGFLFLGASDFVCNYSNPLEPYHESGVTFYKKNDTAQDKNREVLHKKNTKITNKSYQEIQSLEAVALREIKELLAGGYYETVLHKINNTIELYGKNAYILFYRANALVALGDALTALESCKLALGYDDLNEKIYLLKGLIHLDLQEFEFATQSFKQATISNPDYAEPHYHLALILLRDKCKKEAVHELKMALKLAKKQNPEKTVDQSNKVLFSSFIKSVEQSILLHEGEA
jgi:chemotaxis protein methyltransferase CheR